MAAHPPLGILRTVADALRQAGLHPTLGGSGLLLAHGLVDHVRDWDLLVDAERAIVETALTNANLAWSDADHGGPYATTARLVATVEGVEVDVMVRFAIWPDGVPHTEPPVHIPSLPGAEWNGVALGSLEAWLVAYRLMHRPQKPDRIHAYLHMHGVDHKALRQMLTEPVPYEIRAELEHLTAM